MGGLLAVGATAGGLCGLHWLRKRDPERAILDELKTYSPLPVMACDDYLLLKCFFDTEFEVRIVSRSNGKIIASMRSPDSQLALGFSADGKLISYLSCRGGDRRFQPYIFDISKNSTFALNAPHTGSAARPIRWAAPGRHLAYCRVAKQTDLVVVDLAIPEGAAHVALNDMATNADFCWSPDGSMVATARRGNEGAIWLGGKDGTNFGLLPVAQGGEVREVEWSPDGKSILSTARRRGGEYTELFEVDIESGAVARRLSLDGDISDPHFVSSGSRLLFQLNTKGHLRLISSARDGTDRLSFATFTGKPIVRGFSRSGEFVYIVNVGLHSPPILYEARIDGTLSSELYATPEHTSSVVADRVQIIAKDGIRVPGYIWSGQSKLGVLVLVHGGPLQQELPVWDAHTQMAVRAGYVVIAVNYRGSTGYGASYESTSGDPVLDILAARDLAVTKLGISPRNVFFHGISYGTLLAAEAAAREPDMCGGAVLLSLVRPLGPSPPLRRPPRKLAAFHGANDNLLPPELTHGVLEHFFGKKALMPPDRTLTILDDEGHHFHKLQSWARVGAAIAELLE